MQRRTLAILFVTGVTLAVGFGLKASCFYGPWDERAYQGLCYSDIPPLYGVRGFDRDVMPYVDHGDTGDVEDRDGFNEYPVVTGLFMWGVAVIGTARAAILPGPESYIEYFLTTAILLSVFAVGTTLVLARATTGRAAVLFAAAPSLALYAFHNWDLLAVFFTVLALFLHARGRPAWAGLAIGLGAASKLYPLLLAPPIFFDLVASSTVHPWPRRLIHRRVLVLTGTVLGTIVLLHAPFLIQGTQMVFATYQFHAERLPNFETPWYALHFWRVRDGHAPMLEDLKEILPKIQAGALLVSLVVTGWGVTTRRLDAAQGSLLLILTFLLTNKVYSVQYALWVLPFFAFRFLPLWSYAVFLVADVAVYVTLFPALGLRMDMGGYDVLHSEAGADAFRWTTWAIILRHATLLLLLLLTLRPTRLSPPADSPAA